MLEELLRERPIEAVEIDDVASRAGITRSGFYFYFPTKHAGVAALFERLGQQLVDVARDWYERDDIPHQQRVRDGLAATIEFWRAHHTLMIAITDAAGHDGSARELWRQLLEQLRTRAAQRISTDQAAGLIADDVDADMLAPASRRHDCTSHVRRRQGVRREWGGAASSPRVAGARLGPFPLRLSVTCSSGGLRRVGHSLSRASRRA